MQEFAKNYPMDDELKKVDNEQPELKFITDTDGSRKYEMTCQDCEQSFTRSIPNSWFNGDNEIKQHNLPENFDADGMQAVLDNPLCGACQPETKKKLEDLKNINNQ
ncbi:MAG: hypothetical protein ACNFW9_04735 [Candidatus Kerfeldbacteria bacterium]|jgi:hypothetical protein